MEARRIELLSKNRLPSLSTGVVCLYHSPGKEPANRLIPEVSSDAWWITRLLIHARSPLIDAHMRPRYSAIGRAAFNYAARATVLLSVNFKVFSFEVSLRSLPAYEDSQSLSKPLRPRMSLTCFLWVFYYITIFLNCQYFFQNFLLSFWPHSNQLILCPFPIICS